jgi:hypothetical protein
VERHRPWFKLFWLVAMLPLPTRKFTGIKNYPVCKVFIRKILMRIDFSLDFQDEECSKSLQ